MKNKQTIQIIGGKFKGRKLKMANLSTTRSSKAILKESLFNTLYTDVVGVNFVEFFAGTGSIGCEALSRGAKCGIFFEKDKDSYEVLKENLQTICNDCDYKIIFGDTFSTYKELNLKTPSIAYFDPPFCIRDGMDDIYDRTFNIIKNLDSKVFLYVIIEHISSIQTPQNIGNFTLIKSKKFGNSTLSYYKEI